MLVMTSQSCLQLIQPLACGTAWHLQSEEGHAGGCWVGEGGGPFCAQVLMTEALIRWCGPCEAHMWSHQQLSSTASTHIGHCWAGP